MLDFFRRTMLVGLGALSFTKEKAEQLVEELVNRGDIGRDEAKNLLEELKARGEEQAQAVAGIVRREMDRLKGEIGLVNRGELEALEARVKELEERVAKVEGRT